MIRNNASHTGIVLKQHGTRGEILIHFKNIDPEGIEPGDTLFIELNETLVPFIINEISLRESSAVFKLEYVDSVSEAAKFSGCNVFFPDNIYNKIRKKTAPGLSTLIGYSFIDLTTGVKGVVKEFIDHELNPLLVIKSSGQEFLVPVNSEIISSIDHMERKLEARLPDGLINL